MKMYYQSFNLQINLSLGNNHGNLQFVLPLRYIPIYFFTVYLPEKKKNLLKNFARAVLTFPPDYFVFDEV